MANQRAEEAIVQEYTAPGEVPLPDDAHLLQPLQEHARATPSKPLLAYRQGDTFVDVSASEFLDTVERLARGLIGLGVQPGDRVVIMSATSIEWTYLDYAILATGAITVPIYDTSSAEQVEWIVSDSGAVAAFLQNDELKATYDEVAGNLPACKNVFVIERDGLEELAKHGESVDPQQVAERIEQLGPDKTATIIYTSGTTGRPKGCVLTHGNLRWDLLQVKTVIEGMVAPDDQQLLFLPLAHSFAKILLLVSVETGAKVGFASNPRPETLREEMPLFQPTFLSAVPRIFERIYNGARQVAADEGKGKIFDKSADVAISWSEAQDRGGAPLLLNLQHKLFDVLVYKKIRARFGGRLRLANSGGGPLGARLTHYFNGVGIQVYEGYGLTETSPVLTCNRIGAWRIGTVGQPIPGTTIRIAEDGEILAKGGQIFQGYYNNEAATKEVLDADGWFRTGDIGELDAEGYVKITGRKKEIIVTAGGKNVAPAVLEDRLRAHPLISQAMVVGDNKPFIAALITLDEEQLPAWAERNSKPGRKPSELADDSDLVAEVQAAIDDANKAVSKAESIRKWEILPSDFTIDGGELTPTLKVKRNVVHERYGDEIEGLYSQ
jgi:long-chain acyl-CoA synthetase